MGRTVIRFDGEVHRKNEIPASFAFTCATMHLVTCQCHGGSMDDLVESRCSLHLASDRSGTTDTDRMHFRLFRTTASDVAAKKS